jgi:DnaJ-class molecular chaperone
LAKKDFYKILNIDHKASTKAVKTAYRQLALKYHPDHNPNNPKAVEMFTLIKEAYDILSDPDLRKKYDFTYTPSKPEPVVEPQKPDPLRLLPPQHPLQRKLKTYATICTLL